MATMYGKSHAVTNAGIYYRSSPYQSDYYLTSRSTWSKISVDKANNTTLKFGSAILILSVLLVLIAVMAIGGLALWMGAFRTDSKNVIVGFSCSFRIVRGEKYNPMLKLNTSMVFREKERKFKNIFELLFRRSVLGSSYKQTTIDKFENNTLKVFFRLYLDRRKIPRSITNVEDTIKDIIIKETYSISSLFKNMEIDLRTISVKRINQEDTIIQKQEQQKYAVVSKNGLLRSNRNSSLITIPIQKTKPIKTDSAEPNIDFSNVPTIQGIYTATKINVSEENERTAELVTESISRTTALNEASNLKELLLMNEPLTTVTKRTLVALNDHTSDEQTANAIKTISLESTTSNSFDTFGNLGNPDFGASLWRPILSGYINTQYKFPHKNIKELNHTMESSTQKTASPVSDNPKLLTRTTISTDSSGPEITNVFDTENTTFPQDGIVPDSTFRPNTYDNKHSDIEVAGQLPLEMFSVKLRASHNTNNRMTSTSEISATHKVIENAAIEDNVLFKRGLNATRKVEEKFHNLLSTTESYNNGLHRNDKIMAKTPISGIGVAEPVPDSEIELEAKNQYSDILRGNKEILRDRKITSSLQQPVYTSYNTSDLSGGNFVSSLIETPANTKPFRHTIPVDKVTSVINYSNNVSRRNLSISSLLRNVPNRNTTKSNAFQGKIVTDSERIIRDKILVTQNNDEMIQLPKYEENTSTESSLARMNNNKLKYVSRNSTFIEIGIVKHTPNDLKETSELYTADNGITKENEVQTKIYNDTLKAYVIENFVTPVSSNTGIDRPTRSRPKIKDLSVNKTTLLEQLFRVYTNKNDTINTDESIQHFPSYEIQLEIHLDPTKSNEKESS